MCIEIAPITQDCATVNGGLIDAIYIAHKQDVLAIPAPTGDTGSIEGDITMQPIPGAAAPHPLTKLFQPWAFVEDTGSMKEDSVGDKGFGSVKTTIASMIKGNKAQVTRQLNQLLNGSFVVIVTDSAGQNWVIGTTKRGVQLAFKRDWGAKGEDKNHCALEFMVTSGGALPYNGVIPTA